MHHHAVPFTMSTSSLYCDNKLDILDTFQRSSSSATSAAATQSSVSQSMTSVGGTQYTTSAAAGGSVSKGSGSSGGGTIQEVAARLNGGGKSDVNAGRSICMYIHVCILCRSCVVWIYRLYTCS